MYATELSLALVIDPIKLAFVEFIKLIKLSPDPPLFLTEIPGLEELPSTDNFAAPSPAVVFTHTCPPPVIRMASLRELLSCVKKPRDCVVPVPPSILLIAAVVVPENPKEIFLPMSPVVLWAEPSCN